MTYTNIMTNTNANLMNNDTIKLIPEFIEIPDGYEKMHGSDELRYTIRELVEKELLVTNVNDTHSIPTDKHSIKEF